MQHNDFDDVSVIMPLFNEADVIADMVRRVKTVNPAWEIIVVDDASSDDSAARAEAAGARVVRHTYNLGNGASVRSGALAATRETLVMLDSDGQHPPEVIPQLLQYLPAYDMAVGARTEQSDTDAVRNIGNWGLKKIASWLSGHDIPDLTSGFRAVKKKRYMEFFDLYPLRYSYPTTITMSMLCSGRFVKFHPVPSIARRKIGKSGIVPLRDGFRFISIIMRVILLFHPFRVFFPSALALACCGLAMGVFQITWAGTIGNATLLLLQTSVITFFFGLIAEQISLIRRRSRE